MNGQFLVCPDLSQPIRRDQVGALVSQNILPSYYLSSYRASQSKVFVLSKDNRYMPTTLTFIYCWDISFYILFLVLDYLLIYLTYAVEFLLGHRLHGWLTDFMTDSLTSWLTHWLHGWLTDFMADSLTSWLTHWLHGWLTDFMTDSLTSWLTHWLHGWLTHFMADSLT